MQAVYLVKFILLLSVAFCCNHDPDGVPLLFGALSFAPVFSARDAKLLSMPAFSVNAVASDLTIKFECDPHKWGRAREIKEIYHVMAFRPMS